MEELGFPLIIRLTHFFNILFLSLLARSGIEILGAHPLLYWNDHCTPGSEWIRFTPRAMPRDRLWTGEDEKQRYSAWISLPGGDALGIGRYWHFTAVLGWIVVGVLYLALLFLSPQWHRLIPTSWAVVPGAIEAARLYLRFQLPETAAVFNPLQQLAYFALIFILAPVQILTGIAMSPALGARFPRFIRCFGGRQGARSIHFIGLVLFGTFTVHHTAIVIAHGLGGELAKIVLGVVDASPEQAARAIRIGILGLAIILLVHLWATRISVGEPRRVQHLLQHLVDPVRQALLGRLTSRQAYRPDQRTRDPRPNGRPPRNEEYQSLLEREFRDWTFIVDGLVERPLAFTIEELRALPASRQTTLHCCIQGWSYIAEWEGVRIRELLQRCRPRPEASFLLFETFDEKWEAGDQSGPFFYTIITREQAEREQTILAYGMNGSPLPVDFGAPLRLRLEEQLGFKMAKYIRRLTLVEEYRDIGAGEANWRADHLHYSPDAPI